MIRNPLICSKIRSDKAPEVFSAVCVEDMLTLPCCHTVSSLDAILTLKKSGEWSGLTFLQHLLFVRCFSKHLKSIRFYLFYLIFTKLLWGYKWGDNVQFHKASKWQNEDLSPQYSDSRIFFSVSTRKQSLGWNKNVKKKVCDCQEGVHQSFIK